MPFVGSFPSAEALKNYIQQRYDILSEEGPVTPAPTEPALAGDVNGDGAITVSDALIILRFAMHPIGIEDESIADVNGNGTVEASDAILMLRAATRLT